MKSMTLPSSAAKKPRAAGTNQILPTSSSDGLIVFSPSFHFAGQTSPGWLATNCAALSLRTVSVTSRAMALSWISRS